MSRYKRSLVIPLIISLFLMAIYFPIPNGRRWTDAGAHYFTLSKQMNEIENIYAPARGSTLYAFTRPPFLFLQNYVSYEIVGLVLFCLSLLVSSYAIFFIASHVGFTRLQATLIVLALGLIEANRFQAFLSSWFGGLASSDVLRLIEPDQFESFVRRFLSGANLTIFGYGQFFVSDYGFNPRTTSTAFLLLALFFFLRRVKAGFLVVNLLAFFFHPIHALVFNIALVLTTLGLMVSRRGDWRWPVLLFAFIFLYITFLGVHSGELCSIFGPLCGTEYPEGQPQLDHKVMYSVFVYSRHPWYSVFDREHLSRNAVTILFIGAAMLVYGAVRRSLPDSSRSAWYELMLLNLSSVVLIGVHALNDMFLMDYRVLLLSLFRNAFVSIFATLLFCAFLARRYFWELPLKYVKLSVAFKNKLRLAVALALLGVIASGLGRIKLDLVRQEQFIAKVEAELNSGYRPLFGNALVLAPPRFSTQYFTNQVVSWKLDPTDPKGYPEWISRMDMVTNSAFSTIAKVNAERSFWQQPCIPSSTMWNEMYFNLPETTIQSIADKFGVIYVVTKATYGFPLAFELNDYDGQIYHVYRLK